MNSIFPPANPLISVVMPVYNAVLYVEQAVKSIQNQTYPHWELILIDDASTDGTYDVVKQLAKSDSRIHLFRNRTHRGVSKTATMALRKARGKFIARMDGDDISQPDRFQLQLEFLQTHPDTVAVGGQCRIINKLGLPVGEKRFPTDSQAIKDMAFYFYPIQQPAMMVNTSLLPPDFVWYPTVVDSAEEHELLFKFFQHGKVANLEESVLQYRIHGKNISLQQPKSDFYFIFRTRLNAIKKYDYHPTLKGWVLNFVQLLSMSVVPERLIYPLYSLARGLKSKKHYTLHFDASNTAEIAPSFSVEK